MTRRRILLLLTFLAICVIGVALLTFAELQHEKAEREKEEHAKVSATRQEPANNWRVIGILLMQHLASALIVASVMGVSYEYFVHKHVIDDFDELLREHERATEGAYNAFRATTARDVFTLLGNIASNSAKTPTLFDPPREATSEVVFSTDRKFYERLVGGEKARAEAVEVLAPWLESQSLNLRFLGSDFVGLLRLSELAPRLRELAAERQKHWKALSEQERSAVLNFWWAASACDDSPYQSLKMQLLEWQDPFVQKWILFVARQMPDGDLAHLVKLFLRTRAAKVRRDVLEVAISAIEALHHSGFDMRRTVHRHRQVFEAASFWDEACASVSAVPAEVRPRNWRSRTRRFLGLE